MQTLTRMDKVIIEDYYHMTIGDENVNWMKLTHLLLTLNLKAFFWYIYMYFKNLNNLFGCTH